ncbi:uncharacterized protein LOC117173632 [Belonocnema kinseyi]|uniref:uncharacterized protein LOC117173632 n=1 Tax=Belonocnema kinseyi TaxID=2817044 RepID=UPI00143CDB32|nr:uncharacterized protein LOC117173632 [Belonocnema kinseyi]
MWILLCFLFFTLATCSNPIDIGSPSSFSRNVNSAPDVPRGVPSAASSSPKRNRRPVIDLNNPPVESPPPSRPNSPLRARSRSPPHSRSPPYIRPFLTRFLKSPTMLPSPDGLGCGFEQLEFLRVISRKNPRQIFELRRHTFVQDNSLKIIVGSKHKYDSLPSTEHIVLSTHNGIAVAILESYDYFAGIYKRIKSDLKRVKVYMDSHNVTAMEKDEMAWTPIGPRKTIMSFYEVVNIKLTPLHRCLNKCET